MFWWAASDELCLIGIYSDKSITISIVNFDAYTQSKTDKEQIF